jgi:hypothetical protein
MLGFSIRPDIFENRLSFLIMPPGQTSIHTFTRGSAGGAIERRGGFWGRIQTLKIPIFTPHGLLFIGLHTDTARYGHLHENLSRCLLPLPAFR